MEVLAWAIVIGFLWWFVGHIARGFRGGGTSGGPSSSRGYPVEVVGESHYQAALEAICGGRSRDGAQKEVTACLILENTNPYDENAVRVDVDGRTVGYLPRPAARTYRRRLKKSGRSDATVECAAIIRGGWDRGRSDKGYFGIWLNVQV